MILTAEDRLMILAAALGAVSCTLIIMFCKICHWCPLYRWCPLRAKYRKEEEEEWELNKKRSEYQELHYYSPNNGPLPTVKVPLVDNWHSATPGDNMSSQDTSSGKSVSSPGNTRNSSPSRSFNSNRRSKSAHSPPHLIIGGQQLTGRTHYDSTLSVTSGTTASPVGTPKKLLSFFDYSTTEDESHSKPAELDFALKYDSEQEKLGIHAKCARNLPASIFGTPNDCFLRILLVRDLKKGWRRNSNMSMQDLSNSDVVYDSCQFQTQLARKSGNPVFNEYFAAELKEKDKKYSVVKFAVCSVDRFGAHNVVAECYKNLSKLTLKEMTDFTVQMKENKMDLGEMQLSLSYLPTAERLTLIVNKLGNLKNPPGVSLDSLSPYVKFALLHKGKTLEKHKSSVKHGTNCATFSDETITFDLPNSEVDKTTLILTVAHQEAEKETQESPESGQDDACSATTGGKSLAEPSPNKHHRLRTSPSNRARRRSVGNVLEVKSSESSTGLHKSRSSGNIRSKIIVLGRLAVGCHVSGTGRDHWLEMMRNPRQAIVKDHKLLP